MVIAVEIEGLVGCGCRCGHRVLRLWYCRVVELEKSKG